ncbi:O-antigen ligase family protein, partial [Vibrio cholerae]
KLPDFTFAFFLVFFLLLGKKIIDIQVVEANIFLSLFVYGLLFFTSFLFLGKCILIPLLSIITLPFFLTGEFNSFGLYKIINLIFCVQVLTFVYTLLRSRLQWERVFIYFSIMLAAYIIFVVLFMVLFKGWFFGQRVTMGLNGPITFSRFNFLVSLAIILFCKMKNNIIYAAPFGVVGGAMASKGPLLSLIVSLLYYYWKNITIKRVFLSIIAIYAVFLSIEYFSPRLYNFLIDISKIIIEQDYSVIYSDYNSGSLGSRATEWIHAFSSFLLNPMGIGAGNWSLYGEHLYPHNLFFEIITEFGFLGLLFCIVFVFSAIRVKNTELKAIILFLFVNSLFSGSVLDNSLLFVLVIIGRLDSNA